jgi:DNA-binding transcriptional regulator YhcF (GntR family)
VLAATTVRGVPEVERTPPYVQVAQHYRDAIRAGRLTAGDELPSVRSLAASWEIAVSTAQRAISILVAEGWIESRPGKPSVVASRPPRR